MRTIDTQEKRIEAFEALRERWEATKLPRVAPVPESESSTEQDEQEQMRIEAVNSISDEFEQDTLTKMRHILDNFDGTYREMLEKVLTEMLQVGVENETKKNG